MCNRPATNGRSLARAARASLLFAGRRAVALAALAILLSAGSASALPIQWRLDINPIRVCDDAGVSCANTDLTLWEAEADKLWAQAGIDVQFLSVKQWDDASRLDITATSDLLGAGSQAMGGTVINMWFVNSYAGAYGAAYRLGRRIAVADDVWSWMHASDPGLGRRDTIAHEIGHILGLSHTSGLPLNLMETGGTRNAISQLAQITPGITPDGGLGLTSSEKGQLTAAQILTAQSSPYLVTFVPEPGTALLLGLGLVLIAFSRRAGHSVQREHFELR
jgi:hypothetical protein